MFSLDRLFKVVKGPLAANVVHAHCDIPCGIYDPHLAQIAALSVIRMNQLIEGLPPPAADASPGDRGRSSAHRGSEGGAGE